MIWAGNSGTQPNEGSGTSCGTATLSNSLNGASYNSSYLYTHLGQLWQGPLNGTGANLQYLYCNSGQPHQVTGLYAVGSTCATATNASYSASYDSWGNETTRRYNGTTATLSYDKLDKLVQWNAGSTNQAWYAYDASGSRTLARSITSSGTSLTVYVFGLEEHVYNGTGSNVSNTYYYMLGGRLIGKFDGTTTQYYLTDAQGSVLTTFSNAATTTSVSGYQAYGPYGNKLASSGSMGTAKGFTGQYQDPSGLDYYNARYYDPVIGCFTSADVKQGNAQGMDPYSYVNGNPETLTDPTGQVTHCHEPGDCGPGSYTTDVGGGDTGPVQSICIYSCYIGSGGSNDSGGCTGSCDGPYHPKPRLNGGSDSRSGNGGGKCGSGTNWNGGQCVANIDNTQAKDDIRQNNLNRQFIAGAALLLSGGIMVAITDIYVLKKGLDNVDVPTAVATIADLIGIVSEFLGVLSYINAALGQIAYGLLATLHFMLGVANSLLSMYNFMKAGWNWALGIVRTGLQALQIPIAGLPGVLFNLATEFLGRAVIAGVRAVGENLMGSGATMVADAIYQQSMNVDDWCAHYGKGACPAP